MIYGECSKNSFKRMVGVGVRVSDFGCGNRKIRFYIRKSWVKMEVRDWVNVEILMELENLKIILGWG